MQISKINSFTPVNNSKMNTCKPIQPENTPDNNKEISFSGLGLHNFIKTVFKKEVASTGKYPLSAKDLILRLKPGMSHSTTKASGNHVWVNEYLPGSKNAVRETLFADKGSRLSQVHSYNPVTGASKKSVYFDDNGKNVRHVEIYNKDGQKTKSLYFSQENNKLETVTNYDTNTGDELNWVHYKADGKTVAFIHKPEICGGDTFG